MPLDAATARTWHQEGRDAALLRVTDAAGLGPRPTAELLLIDADGTTAGSLLGGAVDDALEAAARDALDATTTERTRMITLDISDDAAEPAGLTCGGYVSVLIQPLSDVPSGLWDALAGGQPSALATIVQGGTGTSLHRPRQATEGALGSAELDDAADATARALLARPGHHVERLTVADAEMVVEAWHPVPRVVSVGVSALADALERQAELLGWPAQTVSTLDEALAATATLTASDVIVVIDHDHSVATPVLAAALRDGVGYVGALGSRHTQQARREHLIAAGVDEATLARLHAPTGLDLGARTPAETAISIVAEVLASRSGRSAASLAATDGRIGGT
jgi:xanthine dehydrogenase accessory factor